MEVSCFKSVIMQRIIFIVQYLSQPLVDVSINNILFNILYINSQLTISRTLIISKYSLLSKSTVQTFFLF